MKDKKTGEAKPDGNDACECAGSDCGVKSCTRAPAKGTEVFEDEAFEWLCADCGHVAFVEPDFGAPKYCEACGEEAAMGKSVGNKWFAERRDGAIKGPYESREDACTASYTKK